MSTKIMIGKKNIRNHTTHYMRIHYLTSNWIYQKSHFLISSHSNVSTVRVKIDKNERDAIENKTLTPFQFVFKEHKFFDDDYVPSAPAYETAPAYEPAHANGISLQNDFPPFKNGLETIS